MQLDDKQLRSALDVILDRLERTQKQSILSRSVWLTKLQPSASTAQMNQFTREAIKTCSKHQDGAQFMSETELQAIITGIQLGIGNYTVTVMESSPRFLEAFYQHIASNADARQVFDGLRILVYCDDVPQRFYPMFIYRDVAVPTAEVTFDEENIASTLSDMYGNLLSLGEAISSQKEHQLMQFLESMKSTCVHLLPSPDLLKQVFLAKDVMSLDEFVETFVLPVDVALDNELVWPPPRVIDY